MVKQYVYERYYKNQYRREASTRIFRSLLALVVVLLIMSKGIVLFAREALAQPATFFARLASTEVINSFGFSVSFLTSAK